jgi:hypothetical protein
MTTITWNISVLDCLPQSAEGADYVVTAHWQCTGVDGEHSASVYATCSFPVVESDGGEFIPYSALTLEQVLGWAWASGVDKDATEAAVEGQIEAQKNPPIVSPPLPWSV